MIITFVNNYFNESPSFWVSTDFIVSHSSLTVTETSVDTLDFGKDIICEHTLATFKGSEWDTGGF